MRTKKIKTFKELKVGDLIKYDWANVDTLEIVCKVYDNLCVSFVLKHSDEYEKNHILETTDVHLIKKVV